MDPGVNDGDVMRVEVSDDGDVMVVDEGDGGGARCSPCTSRGHKEKPRRRKRKRTR